jgi:uncharacterized membrane protein (DUF4010 family)
MLDLDLALRFAAAIGIGLLLGIERERSGTHDLLFGGVRTFALIALLGAVGAFAHAELGVVWLAPVALVCVAAFVLASYTITAPKGEIGLTSEVSALLAFALGFLCGWGSISVASAIAVAALMLLVLKESLRGLAARLEPPDLAATLKFAVISLIILPLLPNEAFGPPPFDVVNPYKIWWMVVLIAGLNFIGYVLVKWLGNEHGLGVTGLLGGLVSSTAVTLGFAQRSRAEPAQSSAFAVAIVVAWTVMFVRVIVMVGIVNRAVVRPLALPLGLMALVCALAAWTLWRRSRSKKTGSVVTGANPFELGQAIQFGLLFGVVTVGSRAAELYFGDAGLYLAGALAGLTDVDAITLSMANLALSQPEKASVAALSIAIAAVSNTLVKSALAASLGAPALRRSIALVTSALLGAAVLGIAINAATR